MSSGKEFPLLSLFEMPFPVWRHACKTGRRNISKHLPPGQVLPELSEEDYRLWYARYLNHIAKNYNEFLEGIMSGFPEPQYPPEVQDMIINYKIKMSINSESVHRPGMMRDEEMFSQSSSNIIKEELDDGELFPIGRNRSTNAVVIEYGHHTDAEVRKRKLEDEYLEYKAKLNRIDEIDRRLSRDSMPSSSYISNGPVVAPPGFSFKSEDEFKYKVKSLILYYLDKTLLEKGLIDAHTKKAKVPETTLPNPYASHAPTQAAVAFDVKSPISFPGKDRERRHLDSDRRMEINRRLEIEKRLVESERRHTKERLGKIYDRFQRSNSNSGSERGMSTNHVDRDKESYHKSLRDKRNSIDKSRGRRGRERDKKSDDELPNTIVVIPKPDSSCDKCRRGEECWDC